MMSATNAEWRTGEQFERRYQPRKQIPITEDAARRQQAPGLQQPCASEMLPAEGAGRRVACAIRVPQQKMIALWLRRLHGGGVPADSAIPSETTQCPRSPPAAFSRVCRLFILRQVTSRCSGKANGGVKPRTASRWLHTAKVRRRHAASRIEFFMSERE